MNKFLFDMYKYFSIEVQSINYFVYIPTLQDIYIKALFIFIFISI